jgi:hypothetical protein
MDVSFDQAVEHKRERTAPVAEIRELLEEIISRIEPNKSEYFNS